MLIGIVLIPYPGPGWLIVFAGFGILATEFDFAAKALTRLKEFYEKSLRWFKRQHISLQMLAMVGTGVLVVGTVWVMNGFGIANHLVGLPYEWLKSPFLW